MLWKRFVWMFAGWIVVGSALGGALMSLGVGPDMARYDAATIAISIVRMQATGIAAIALCLGVVAGLHGRTEAHAPPALALIVPVAAAVSALIALGASALVLHVSAGLSFADYRTALARHVDASDPLLGFMRACLVAGALAASTPWLFGRLNRAVEWLPAKVFVGWLYAVGVVAVIELGMRALLLRWLG